MGAGGRFGAIHSQSPAGLFMNVPDIKIVAPSTPEDAYGLLRASIRDDGPVVFLEHKFLYQQRATSADLGSEAIPLGVAKVLREGNDVTVVAAQRCAHRAVEAADRLSEQGIGLEVIDPRTLKPLDVDTVASSVERTGVLIAMDEGPRFGSWTGELVAAVSERVTGCAVRRIGGPDRPLPFSPVLEDQVLPSSEVVAQVAAELHKEKSH
jgi:pyruvate/2-oxoglutarate/acetoin dehydrogenase E1 component